MKLFTCRWGLLLLPLLGLLGGCAVYDHFFHPHRLGSPRMTAKAKKQAHDRYKELHKPTTLGPAEETIKGDKDAAPAAAAPAGDKDSGTATAKDDQKKTYGDLSDNIRNTYDRKLLLKRSFVQRLDNNSRKLHHYAKPAPAHNEVNKSARHHRHYVRNRKEPADPTAAASAASRPRPKDPIRAAAGHPVPVVAARARPAHERPAPPRVAARPGTPVKPTDGIGKKPTRPAVVKARPVKPNTGAVIPPTSRPVPKAAARVKPNNQPAPAAPPPAPDPAAAAALAAKKAALVRRTRVAPRPKPAASPAQPAPATKTGP